MRNAEKQTIPARHEGTDIFRSMADHAPVLIWMSGPDARCTFVNRSWLELTGRTMDQELGDGWTDGIHPDDLRSSMATYKIAFKKREGFRMEYRLRRFDGEYRWILDTGTPTFSPEGCFSGYIGSAIDISERKEMEEALQKSRAESELGLLEKRDQLKNIKEALTAEIAGRRKAERLFRRFAEHAGTVFWMGPAGTNEIIYVNQAYETIWGRSVESLMQNPKSWLDAVYEEDRPVVSHIFRIGSRGIDWAEEYRIVRPDGSIRWVRDRSFAIPNADGTVDCMAGIAEDVTEEKKLRQESEYRLQQVIQADKLSSLGEMVAGVAHEINNPNSFITYNVPLLEQTWRMLQPIVADFARSQPDWRKSGLTLDELCQDMEGIIQDIKTGSDRINKVVRNLKDFARVEKSEHTKPVQINDIVEKTMLIVGAQLRKSVAKIDLNLAHGLPEIEGHFSKLEQVVANLLVNAAHSITKRETGRISVTTRYVKRLKCVLIEIEDNGGGIPSSLLDRIFEPFFTTRRTSGGTGLGLSVSYGLVQEHNGHIGVLSRQGLGTRVTVYLPDDKAMRPNLRPTILCVDDDTVFLNMLQTQFLRIEKCTEGLHDPESVLAFIEEYPEVDIILSDLLMPKVNGWELLKKIKEKYPLITIILYSGDSMVFGSRPEDVPKPDYMLSKPFPMQDLIDIINTIGRQKL